MVSLVQVDVYLLSVVMVVKYLVQTTYFLDRYIFGVQNNVLGFVKMRTC